VKSTGHYEFFIDAPPNNGLSWPRLKAVIRVRRRAHVFALSGRLGAGVMFDVAKLPDERTVERYTAAADFERQPAVTSSRWTVATDPLKRLFDILASGLGLLLFLPLLVLVSALIKLESPGPAIFRQRRTGYRGRVFTIFKFRTMTVTEDCAAVRQATRGDERVTAIGALLRKLSIDELPQLVNVLMGDMSIVGPRPHALAHDEYYGALIPSYAARFRARPGLTGYAQVNGFRGEIRDVRGMSDRVAADNSYIEEWSPALDVAILARTVPLIFSDPRAY
jgi:undecaprenyl-phosphate glucose phosphotransferase